MDNTTVDEVYNDRVLLQGDNIDHIITNAISEGMFVNKDGKAIEPDNISDDDKYELMVMFIQFIMETNKEIDSRFIIAKA
jgi:hypothetical protein